MVLLALCVAGAVDDDVEETVHLKSRGMSTAKRRRTHHEVRVSPSGAGSLASEVGADNAVPRGAAEFVHALLDVLPQVRVVVPRVHLRTHSFYTGRPQLKVRRDLRSGRPR